MNIELWRNVKIVDTSATATKRLIKIIAVGLVTAILLGTTIGHTKQMDKVNWNFISELEGKAVDTAYVPFEYGERTRHKVKQIFDLYG